YRVQHQNLDPPWDVLLKIFEPLIAAFYFFIFTFSFWDVPMKIKNRLFLFLLFTFSFLLFPLSLFPLLFTKF
ncbi:MAG: hypothetical protein LH478_14105, partial [Chitinophagaceae bacterium]|nr:hypothetical protein [Chitinophagaceae bacterium]